MRRQIKAVAGSFLNLFYPITVLAQFSLNPSQITPELRQGEGVWRAQARQAFETRWESYHFLTNAITGRVKCQTNSYVELAAGLNVPGPDGQYHPASPIFQITERGAEATNTLHRLLLAPNIAMDGAIRISSQGVEVASHPLGLGYFDPVSRESVVLARITDALGWLVASNVVVYSNCFVGLRASILIRNTLAGMSHNVLLEEQPPPPEAYGLSPQSRLEMFTEYLSGTPAPQKTERSLGPQSGEVDATLEFGPLRMGAGRAFSAGDESSRHDPVVGSRQFAPVTKLYEVMEGKNVLVESVEHSRIRPMLSNLPPARVSGSLTNAALGSRPPASGHQLLPVKQYAGLDAPCIQVAESFPGDGQKLLAGLAAFVVDYEYTDLSGSMGDYILRSDETYYVSANALVDDLVIQGGTVVKLNTWDTWMSLEVGGTITCNTEAYLPAIFTGKDDDSVGCALPGSTGNPAANRYGSPMLWVSTPGDTELKHVRFCYANTAIVYYNWGQANRLRHAQVVHCWGSLYSEQADLTLQNVLFDEVDIPSESYLASITAEHVTAHTAFMLGYDYSGTLDFTVKNSLMVNLTQDNPNDYTVQNSQWVAEGPGIFQSVGLGSHYLADNQFRNPPSPAAIDPLLEADLKQMTTYPPVLLPGTITANTDLAPTAPPDDDGLLDLGYHYPILDYLASGVQIQSGTVRIKYGAVIGVDYGSDVCGLRIGGGKLISQGSALKPNRLVRVHVVQEQTGAAAPAWFALFSDNPFQSTWSEGRFRFTEFTGLADSGYAFYGGNYLGHFELSHSQLRNVALYASYYGLAGRIVGWTNNLWESAKVTLSSSQPLSVGLFNNLFTNVTLSLLNGNTSWEVRDNIFDEGSVVCNSPVQNSYNAFVGYTSPGPFQNSGGGIFLAGLDYEEGPLGHYYLPQDIPPPQNLKDGGSRLADQAGLFRFTTSVGQEIEGSSQVDIGLHFAGLDQSGLPYDSDGDGLVDSWELLNGTDALVSDASEDADGDGLSNLEEYLGGTNPIEAPVFEVFIARPASHSLLP
jgi:Bacterial TSP3 repeat